MKMNPRRLRARRIATAAATLVALPLLAVASTGNNDIPRSARPDVRAEGFRMVVADDGANRVEGGAVGEHGGPPPRPPEGGHNAPPPPREGIEGGGEHKGPPPGGPPPGATEDVGNGGKTPPPPPPPPSRKGGGKLPEVKITY